MKKIIKIISYKDYLFCQITIAIVTIISYFMLRPLMLEQSGLTRVYVSPFTLNVAFVFFLALYYWNKYCSKWFKIKNKNTLKIVEYSGAFGIIVIFYAFLQFQRFL